MVQNNVRVELEIMRRSRGEGS